MAFRSPLFIVDTVMKVTVRSSSETFRAVMPLAFRISWPCEAWRVWWPQGRGKFGNPLNKMGLKWETSEEHMGKSTRNWGFNAKLIYKWLYTDMFDCQKEKCPTSPATFQLFVGHLTTHWWYHLLGGSSSGSIACCISSNSPRTGSLNPNLLRKSPPSSLVFCSSAMAYFDHHVVNSVRTQTNSVTDCLAKSIT